MSTQAGVALRSRNPGMCKSQSKRLPPHRHRILSRSTSTVMIWQDHFFLNNSIVSS